MFTADEIEAAFTEAITPRRPVWFDAAGFRVQARPWREADLEAKRAYMRVWSKHRTRRRQQARPPVVYSTTKWAIYLRQQRAA